MDAAFTAWVHRRRSQIHKTQREDFGEQADRDHTALKPLPTTPYPVAEPICGRSARFAPKTPGKRVSRSAR